jgi:hypothetical protein
MLSVLDLEIFVTELCVSLLWVLLRLIFILRSKCDFKAFPIKSNFLALLQ